MNKITFTVDAQDAVVMLNAIPMFYVLMSISEWWLDLEATIKMLTLVSMLRCFVALMPSSK